MEKVELKDFLCLCKTTVCNMGECVKTIGEACRKIKNLLLPKIAWWKRREFSPG